MKNILLIMILCLACICTHAQQIDKKLLYGRWDLYSMNMGGLSLCRDSLIGTIHALREMGGGDSASSPLPPDDSATLAVAAKAMIAEMFKTYFTFEKNGKMKVLLGFEKDETGKYTEESGTYKWSGGNKIIEKLGKAKPDVLVVMSLTPTRLVIGAEDKEKYKDLSMTFTR